MSRKHVQIGEVVLIPVGEEFVPAKVLFLSKYFRNVILLGIYGRRQSEPAMPADLPDSFSVMVYTGQQSIQQSRWLSVGQEALRPNQQGLTKRIVGRDLWVEDQCLGPASESDFHTFPKMRVLDESLVEEKALNV